jgi:hypothetical protein
MENNQQNKNKVCKFFLKNDCHHGDKCRFLHQNIENIEKINTHNHGENVLTNKANMNNSSYQNNGNNKHRKHRKNTESFDPWYEAPNMWVKYGDGTLVKYDKPIHVNDVIIVPKLFDETDIYERLLNELMASGLENKGLWKSWHEDNHLIADDNLNWKEKVPTFIYILDKLKKYYNLNIKSTRLNWYKDSTDFKPFHFDAAAIKPNIAKIQNITVGVSFGSTRDVSFEHAKTRLRIAIPQENGMAYSFSRDVNINFRHGISPIKEEEFNGGRISIIAWGWVDQVE